MKYIRYSPTRTLQLVVHLLGNIQCTFPWFGRNVMWRDILQDDLDISCNTSIKTPVHMCAESRKSAGSSACLLDVMDGVSVDLCGTPENPADIPGWYSFAFALF